MLERRAAFEAIKTALGRAPVVVLTGPRQSGKTTLARRFVDPDSVNYFDLESPPSLARLDEPMTALAALRGVVVIDEVQRRADLFQTLRVLVDRVDPSARFLILGSASGGLLHQASEELGRPRGARASWRVHDAGDGRQHLKCRQHSLATRRPAPVVPGGDRGGQCRLAARVHPDAA